MPQSIPKGLTREHVLQALADLDVGSEHPFGAPTGYELIHEGRRYPPKAVIGLAFRHLTGRLLEPEEFSGGEAPGQANFVLKELGFTVKAIHGGADESTSPLDSALSDAVEAERTRRTDMWRALLAAGGPNSVSSSLLRELGIYGGAQGIWVDKLSTGPVTQSGEGVTVGVLHTGRSHADDLADDCIIYHYPKTRRPAGRDLSEVAATKAAGRLRLPFFVITYPTLQSSLRDVRLGWFEGWDDTSSSFLIAFGEQPPELVPTEDDAEKPFELAHQRERRRHELPVRVGQQRFKFRVLRRYGPRCAVCGVDVLNLLDAAHLRPKQEDGSDDPRNGLIFCPTHHRAFDSGLFAIEPETLRLTFREGGPSAARLGIVRQSIQHLAHQPHPDALRWVWARWTTG
jgi:hypothetical protein